MPLGFVVPRAPPRLGVDLKRDVVSLNFFGFVREKKSMKKEKIDYYLFMVIVLVLHLA